MKDHMAAMLIFTITIFSFINTAQAAKDQEFVDYLLSKICSDCKGKDIVIREGALLYEGKPFSILKWPYQCDQLSEIIKALVDSEPYAIDLGSVKMHGREGAGIISCGEHVLDINHFMYLWDKSEVILPVKKIETYVAGDAVTIDRGSNYVKAGDNITQSAGGGKITYNNFNSILHLLCP